MNSGCWTVSYGDAVTFEAALLHSLRDRGMQVSRLDAAIAGKVGICLAAEISPQLHDIVRSARDAGSGEIIVVLTADPPPEPRQAWELLASGAADLLAWTDLNQVVRQVQARLERCWGIQRMLDAIIVDGLVVGRSRAWRSVLCEIAEIASFSDNSTLLLGESGTGKEVAARLIHRMDTRPGKRDLVVQDCSTVVRDLSGSEFFGHERGSFTGASSDRQGAFALANNGTLFLDEIGELPLQIQAQLLRAIQEGTYKRVGGTVWHRAEFRLVCATNRNLAAMVERGEFRADLYHRIAGHVCRLPPLRERLEDILPLAQSFIDQAIARRGRSDVPAPTLDPMVREYLLGRDYLGNVRELKQVVGRLMHRCSPGGTISIGCISTDERPGHSGPMIWFDADFETVVRRSVMLGAGLKEIGRAAEDCAIGCAMLAEDGSLHRAARRLGVTDRALQLRRAHGRTVGSFPRENGAATPH